MRFELAHTLGWYKESGGASWGFGFQVDHYGDFEYGKDDADDRFYPRGWSVTLMLGAVSLVVYSEAGYESVHGEPKYGPHPRFAVVRP